MQGRRRPLGSGVNVCPLTSVKKPICGSPNWIGLGCNSSSVSFPLLAVNSSGFWAKKNEWKFRWGIPPPRWPFKKKSGDSHWLLASCAKDQISIKRPFVMRTYYWRYQGLGCFLFFLFGSTCKSLAEYCSASLSSWLWVLFFVCVAWCASGVYPGNNLYWLHVWLMNKAHTLLKKRELVLWNHALASEYSIPNSLWLKDYPSRGRISRQLQAHRTMASPSPARGPAPFLFETIEHYLLFFFYLLKRVRLAMWFRRPGGPLESVPPSIRKPAGTHPTRHLLLSFRGTTIHTKGIWVVSNSSRIAEVPC
jgi:hypothetical protein